jgi:hypothetical protein
MTVELYEEVNNNLLSTRAADAALDNKTQNEIHMGSIRATQTAIDFYNEQVGSKQIFNEIEEINEEFREAVRKQGSYPFWYTLAGYYQDCFALLWKDKPDTNHNSQ